MIDPIPRAHHRGAGQHGPVMLMYYAFTPGKIKRGWPWAVSMQQFRDQLRFSGRLRLCDADHGRTCHATEKMAKRTVVITFDDGYANNRGASGVLQGHGMRATWFVVTGSIGESPKWPADGRPKGGLLNMDELREIPAGGNFGTVGNTRFT